MDPRWLFFGVTELGKRSKMQHFKHVRETSGLWSLIRQLDGKQLENRCKTSKVLVNLEFLCYILDRKKSNKKLKLGFMLCFISFNWFQFSLCFWQKKQIILSWRQICFYLCLEASSQPPKKRLRTWTWLAVQFTPWFTVGCEIGSIFRLGAAWLLQKCSHPRTKYQSYVRQVSWKQYS